MLPVQGQSNTESDESACPPPERLLASHWRPTVQLGLVCYIHHHPDSERGVVLRSLSHPWCWVMLDIVKGP